MSTDCISKKLTDRAMKYVAIESEVPGTIAAIAPIGR